MKVQSLFLFVFIKNIFKESSFYWNVWTSNGYTIW